MSDIAVFTQALKALTEKQDMIIANIRSQSESLSKHLEESKEQEDVGLKRTTKLLSDLGKDLKHLKTFFYKVDRENKKDKNKETKNDIKVSRDNTGSLVKHTVEIKNILKDTQRLIKDQIALTKTNTPTEKATVTPVTQNFNQDDIIASIDLQTEELSRKLDQSNKFALDTFKLINSDNVDDKLADEGVHRNIEVTRINSGTLIKHIVSVKDNLTKQSELLQQINDTSSTTSNNVQEQLKLSQQDFKRKVRDAKVERNIRNYDREESRQKKEEEKKNSFQKLIDKLNPRNKKGLTGATEDPKKSLLGQRIAGKIDSIASAGGNKKSLSGATEDVSRDKEKPTKEKGQSDFSKKWEQTKQTVADTFPILKDLKALLVSVLLPLGAKLLKFIPKLLKGALSFAKGVGRFLKGSWNFVKNFGKNVRAFGSKMANVAKSFGNKIKSFGSKMANVAKSFGSKIKSFGSKIASFGKSALQFGKDAISWGKNLVTGGAKKAGAKAAQEAAKRKAAREAREAAAKKAAQEAATKKANAEARKKANEAVAEAAKKKAAEEAKKKAATEAAKKVTGEAAGAATKTAATSTAKTVSKTAGKTLAKSAVKKIPIIGALAGIGFGIQRALGGDFLGAAMEVGSGLASTIPIGGTAASIGIDAALLARDVKKMKSQVPPGAEDVLDPEKFEPVPQDNSNLEWKADDNLPGGGSFQPKQINNNQVINQNNTYNMMPSNIKPVMEGAY